MLYSVIEIEEDDLQEWEEPFSTYCIVEGEQPSALFVGDLAKARIIEFQLVEKGLEPQHIADFISEEIEQEAAFHCEDLDYLDPKNHPNWG